MGEFELTVYEEAFRNIDAPALIVDTGLVIRDVNEAGLEFTGYEYEEFVGQSATIVSDDDETYAEIVEAITDGGAWSGDFELRRKDGERVFGRGSVAPVALDGETRGYVAIFIDTTKQHRYKNAMEVLNRLLRHDLRNDLNAAYGNLENAQARIDDEVASEYLDQVKGALARVVGRSERARNLGELLEQTYETTSYPVRLDHALHEALVDTIDEFDGAQFRFGTFPAVRVEADHRLVTVFEAILENAVVHNDRETPVVDIEIEVEESEDRVVTRIADNGSGVPEDQTDLIFGREEIDQLHHGSGISLFFADNVVENYGGDIRVDTDRTEGTAFEIELKRVT